MAEEDSMADELAAMLETAGNTVNQFEVGGCALLPPPPAPRSAVAPRAAHASLRAGATTAIAERTRVLAPAPAPSARMC